MLRVLSYNILLGGTPRIDQLTSVIRASGADIVGLAEATDPEVVEELARRLGMYSGVTGRGQMKRDWHLALLSRFPILSLQVHSRPSVFTRRYLLEVTLEQPGGEPLTVFVTHLTAGFHRGPQSNLKRRAEVREILSIMAPYRGKPHLLLGDFNSIAPGDSFSASKILDYSLRLREQAALRRQKFALAAHEPYMPPPLRERAIARLLHMVLSKPAGRILINRTSPLYTGGGIDLLLKAGYTDCFRRLHPEVPGYTFPASEPDCRIDYIFVSPELAERLEECIVISSAENVQAATASDHLSLAATFRAGSSSF